jgi:hypothetical protein
LVLAEVITIMQNFRAGLAVLMAPVSAISLSFTLLRHQDMYSWYEHIIHSSFLTTRFGSLSHHFVLRTTRTFI